MIRAVEKIKGTGVLWEVMGRCVQVWDRYSPGRLGGHCGGNEPGGHLRNRVSGRGHGAFRPPLQDSGLGSE